jgi:hypothetical protein
MAYCPSCRIEYVAGVAKCLDCGADLVEALPPPVVDVNESLDEMTVLADRRGAFETRLIVAELEAAGIPYVLAGDVVGAVLIYPAQDGKILVPRHRLARAREILVNAIDAPAPDTAEIGQTAAGDAGERAVSFCDRCGAEVPPTAKKCPGCGEPFENS